MSAASPATAARIGEPLRAPGQGSVVSEVAERLLAHFTTGDVAAGTRLPSERRLAASLGVGRSAVREALAALEILGIVVVRPGSGTYLRDGMSELLPRTLSWGLMLGEPKTLELIECRGGLEIQATQLAATRISEDSLERLQQALDAMQASLHDLSAFVEADALFHREIASSSGNLVLYEVLQSVRSLLQIWVDHTLADQHHAVEALSEHRAVYVALEAGDQAAAVAAMTSHMKTAGRRLAGGYRAGSTPLPTVIGPPVDRDF